MSFPLIFRRKLCPAHYSASFLVLIAHVFLLFDINWGSTEKRVTRLREEYKKWIFYRWGGIGAISLEEKGKWVGELQVAKCWLAISEILKLVFFSYRFYGGEQHGRRRVRIQTTLVFFRQSDHRPGQFLIVPGESLHVLGSLTTLEDSPEAVIWVGKLGFFEPNSLKVFNIKKQDKDLVNLGNE